MQQLADDVKRPDITGFVPGTVRFLWVPIPGASSNNQGSGGLSYGELWVDNTYLGQQLQDTNTDGYNFYSKGVNTQLFTAFDSPASLDFGQNQALNGMQLNANATINSATLDWTLIIGNQTGQPAYPTAYRWGLSPVNQPWPGEPFDCSTPRVIRQRIWGEASTSSGFFTGEAFDVVPNMVKTSAFVDIEFSWDSALSNDSCRNFAYSGFPGEQQLNGIDIKPILQELVQLPGWGPSSMVRLIIEDNGTDSPADGRYSTYTYPSADLSTVMTIDADGYRGNNRPYNDE